MQRLLVHKKTYFSIASLWTILVTYLCLVSFSNLPSLGIGNADKYVHFTFHFIFTLLWFLYFNVKKVEQKKSLIVVFFASLFFGIAIEIAQTLFTTTRKGDVLDVLANTSGAIIAVLVLVLYNKYIKRNTF
jgi:VanZ family protein